MDIISQYEYSVGVNIVHIQNMSQQYLDFLLDKNEHVRI